MKKSAAVFILFLLLTGISFAQSYSVISGITLGTGSVSGRNPVYSVIHSELSLRIKPPFLESSSFEISYKHLRKTEYFLPGNSSSYYPFLNVYGAAFTLNQPFYKSLLLEESLGYIYILNHTFSNDPSYSHGLEFSLTTLLPLQNVNNGFIFTAGIKAGFSITSRSVNYTTFIIGIRHAFPL